MDFPIVSLDKIEREAKEAAEAGHSLNFACSYPFDERSGQHFKKVFNDHRAALLARSPQQQPEGAQ
ncbi:hypothetical protein [Variovorax atrisoli]|uniref:hypothetical protein n=1 Tax=Variovorax atrisoli TaxID=3394203 RepID=UPI001199D351|nr:MULTISPECIES: hypothetical protein [Variovorax]MBB3641142.1 hypothetical protein [Variovorax sp. BK613]MDR6522813.1 hypothetical protein [Variovorax paradoxus]